MTFSARGAGRFNRGSGTGNRHSTAPWCAILSLITALVPGSVWSADPPGPLTPSQSREKVRLSDPELLVELAVSEPAINSPVAITWDAAARMYVVEMSDYPISETGGRIRRLQDQDGDGVFESAITFAEGLKFPNGALAWNGGLLVTCAPDILFLKDTDGDGRADERRVVLTGFAPGNQQLRVNGLFWGLDNWVYGANGRSGGEIRKPDDPPAKAVPIRRHDFRFRPETGEFEALAGFSQFGLGRDDFNHRFLSWNTIPFRHAVIEERDLNRNPYFTSGNSIALIADPSDTGRVYPISSPPRTFNRERTDYFNASCGSMIFRGEGLGAKYQGNAFVGEPLTNLVHRKVLEPSGATFVARRGEQQQEFLASQDGWFHPVNFAMGPDGCLYVADFYREWVEHPQFVQEALRKNVDFRTGNEHGRVWRIRNRNFVPRARPSDLAALASADLVPQLETGNTWERDTAQRLLVERQDAQVVPALEQLAQRGARDVTRAQSLWTLSGLHALKPKRIAQALKDESPAVREQAILLFRAEIPRSDSLAEQVLALAGDNDPRVRFQVALAAGDLDSPQAISAMGKIAAGDAADEWTRLALLSGLGNTAIEFLETLAREHADFFASADSAHEDFLRDAASIIGMRQREPEISALGRLIAESSGKSAGGAMALFCGLSDGLVRRNRSLGELMENPSPGLAPHLPALNRLIAAAARKAADRTLAESQRVLCFRLLVRLKSPEAVRLIPEFVAANESIALQSAAAVALAEFGDPDLARRIIERWSAYSTSTRRELIGALLRRPALIEVLLDAVEQGTISPTEVDLASRESLARIKNKELKERAAKLLQVNDNVDRDAVVAKYLPALELKGEAARGATLFARECLGCHQMQGKGARVGPELSGIASRPKGALLVDILNPTKDVSPDFVQYVVVTRQGQLFTGLLSSETAAAVRLRRIQGAEDTILREEIEELRPHGKSIMPEGFEQKFGPQEMADLLEFLQRPVSLPADPQTH